MKTLHKFTKSVFTSFLLCCAGVTAQAQYCAINFSGGVEPITLVDFNTINNSTQNTGGTAYENFTAMSTTVLAGASHTITVKCNTFGNYVNWVRVFVDWNQNLVFTDPGESFDLGSITNSTGLDAIQVSASITVPAGAVLGSTRMRVTAKWASYATACNTAGYGQGEDYSLNIISANSCTGTPTAGVASGPSSVCPSVPFSLNLSGQTSSNGINFQWENNTGAGWQPIAGATGPSYLVSSGLVSGESYRAVVTCTNGGATDISNVVAVAVNTPTQCYCSISFPSGGEAMTLVDFAGINNASSASSTVQYEDYTSITGTVIQGQIAPIIVKGYTGGAYTDSVMTFVDWDQNGLFTDPGESYIVGTLYNSTGVDAVQATTNIAVPAGAMTGTTRMRVTKKWNAAAGPCNSTGYGQAEDYTINVLVANSCLGVPTAGVASGPASVCPNTSFTLNLTGYTLATGISIQWESAPASSSNWQPLTGATTASYTVAAGISSATDYRAVVTCINGGASDISNTVAPAITPFLNCYCTATNQGSVAITNVSIAGTTLNNTSGAAPAPNYYIAYPSTGTTTASLIQGTNYTFSVTLATAGITSVWIDYDQDGIFAASEWTQVTTASTSGSVTLAVPANAITGQTGMRVRSRTSASQNGAGDACLAMGSGETEDYIITIVPSVQCSGAPTAGTATGPSAVCQGTAFTLNLSGTTVATGISIQWQYNTGTGWTNIAGASSASYTETAGISVPTSYRAEVSCSNNTTTDISNIVAVAVTPANQCYCPVSFPSGGEAITLVNVANINNATSDLSTAQYEDFTSMSTAVLPGSSYPIIVKGNTLGNYTDYIRVYVDWNQNGVFTDPGEDLDLGTITNSTGLDAIQASGSLVVPPSAPLGTTRMRVLKKWNAYSLPCNNAGYGQAEDYSIVVATPLAIVLKDISARNAGNKNQVKWTTGSETRDDHFVLERSSDGQQFYKVYAVQAKGEPSIYTYFDEAPVRGVNYYRLRMNNAAGTFSYSKAVSATVKDAHSFLVQAFPNPAKNNITINVLGSVAANASISIVDVTGKEVASAKLAANTIDMNISGLASGVYIFRYRDDANSQTIQIRKH